MQDPNNHFSGFEQIPSKLEGVLVFAPIPEKDEAQARSYACPQCGGSLKFDVNSSGMACVYCGYLAPVATAHVGRQAQSFEFTLENVQAAEQEWETDRELLHCNNCGAELSYPKGAIAASCPYCGSNKVNLSLPKTKSLRPQVLLPFSATPEALKPRIREWLSKGWMHPKALKDAAQMDKLTPVYLPYWTFSASIAADWKAEVGHYETERYYNSSSKSYETRQVLRWRWENGSITHYFSDLMVNGVSPNRLNHTMLNAIEPYNLSGLVLFSPDYLVGMNVQAYETPLNDAWQSAKQQMRADTERLCEQDTGSSHVRNMSIDMSYDDEQWRYVLLPLYLAGYSFAGQYYNIMLNGQTGKLAGNKPVDWKKVRTITWLIALIPLLLALIGFIVMQISGNSGLLTFGALASLAGIVVSISLYSQAKKAEKLS